MAALIEHDKYCWDCTDSDNALKCLNCIRSFCRDCLKRRRRGNGLKGFQKEKLCPVCIDLDREKNSDGQICSDTLPTIIKYAMENNRYAALKRPLDGPHIVNPMNLTMIHLKRDSYASFAAFMADVKWIRHNCRILFHDQHDVVHAAVKLIKFLENEIETAKMCGECYVNDFHSVCTKIHLIIWAKLVPYDHWPAKVISVNGRWVNVRFFGDHTQANVPVSNCFLYSGTNPSLVNPSDSYQQALNEANLYLENFRTKFGSYNLAKNKTPFDPKTLDQHLQQLIPGAFNAQEAIDLASESSAECSSDSFANEMETYQMHYDPDSSKIPEDVCVNKELSIVLTRANEVPNPKDALPSSDSAQADDEPTNKRVRFATNIEVEPINNPVTVAATNDSTACDAASSGDDETAAPTPNLPEFQQIMAQHMTDSTQALQDYIAKFNSELTKTMATKYDQHIGSLEERIQQLSADRKGNRGTDDKILINRLKMKNRKLKAEISKLQEMIAKKEEEKMQAVDDFKKQWKLTFQRCLDAAEKKLDEMLQK